MYPNLNIKQKLGIFESNQFELIGNSEIEVTYKGFFKSQTGRIPLGIINPNPVKYRKLNVKALFMFVLCLLVVGASVFAYFQDPVKNQSGFIAFGVAFGLFSLLALNSCIKSSVKALLFHNAENGANLFALFPNKSDKSEVDVFVTTLLARVNSIRYPDNLSTVQKYETYRRHIEFLFNEKVITESEFNFI